MTSYSLKRTGVVHILRNRSNGAIIMQGSLSGCYNAVLYGTDQAASLRRLMHEKRGTYRVQKGVLR